MRNLVAWAAGRNYGAWHVIAEWKPFPVSGEYLHGVPALFAQPVTVCGVRVPTAVRVTFREAELRPAEVCAHCWPVAAPVAA